MSLRRLEMANLNETPKKVIAATLGWFESLVSLLMHKSHKGGGRLVVVKEMNMVFVVTIMYHNVASSLGADKMHALDIGNVLSLPKLETGAGSPVPIPRQEPSVRDRSGPVKKI